MYDEGASAAALALPDQRPVAHRLDHTRLLFELYEPGPRDVLRAVLITCVETCIASWRAVRSLGFGSTPSLLNKLPYHRAALRRPGQVRFNPRLEWLQATAAARHAPGSSRHKGSTQPSARPRPRPRYYWRDAFGPGVVIPLNLFLGWLLINADLINIRL